MSIKEFMCGVLDTAFARGVDDITSQKKKEMRGLKIAQRLTRGNVSVQDGKLVTEQAQQERLKEYVKRSERKGFFFQR